MPRDPHLQSKKEKCILEYYNNLDSVKKFGVKLYTSAYCIAATAEKFFLKPATIEYYVYRK